MLQLKHTNVRQFQAIREKNKYWTFKMSLEGHETASNGTGMFPTIGFAVYFFIILRPSPTALAHELRMNCA